MGGKKSRREEGGSRGTPLYIKRMLSQQRGRDAPVSRDAAQLLVTASQARWGSPGGRGQGAAKAVREMTCDLQ